MPLRAPEHHCKDFIFVAQIVSTLTWAFACDRSYGKQISQCGSDSRWIASLMQLRDLKWLVAAQYRSVDG